jgi:predicted 2-oxoglutarate/Fe(II)-dependent dioxygenase YbiX
MSSIGAALLDSLRSVERPGDFCVGGLRQIFMPTLDIDDVGRIAFPLLPDQAAQLVAIAEPAPYGRAEQTVVDCDIRRTWQIDPSRVRIGGHRWEKTLAELVAEASASLGVNEPVAADLYKLLVYDAGSFFVDHRDTEKVAGMFATMVLVLPSVHRGGELIVKHLDREVVLDPHPEEPSEIGFVAFFGDCVHEVRPVTAGYRLTLVYNLRFSTGGRTVLLGISKRGNSYVRRLLIHGARSAFMHLDRSRDRLAQWVDDLRSRMHVNKVVVALAGKIARMAWVLLNKSGALYQRRDPAYG